NSDFEGKSGLIELTLNHMNQGVAVIRPDGRFWLYNKRALEYGGIEDPPFPPTTRDVIAEQLRNEEFGPNGELLPEEVRDFLLNGRGRMPKSYTRRRPNGTVLEIRSDPMPDGSIIQTYTDITELAQAKDAAEAAARAKASFLATMSHEIRTPLNGVIGAARVMRGTPLSPEQARYVETITSCGEALLVVINDILDFSRFESAGVSPDEAPCSPADVLRSAFLVTQAGAEDKGLALSLEGLEELPPAIVTDAKRLRQALINFLGNAVKFTERGSIALRAQVREAAGGKRLRVSVADTGIGIAADSLCRVFKEFSQVDDTIMRRYGGTGLGLAISRKVVEALGGEVGVESELGVGSVFWLEIPLVECDAAPPDAQPFRQPEGSQPSRHVLVAEDVGANRLVIGAVLKSLGHTCEMVGDGLAALELARRGGFDVALIDLQMPRMDGLEAARRIRSLEGEAARLPIVALTASSLAADREASAAAGMNGFVTKPFDPREIAAVVARLTERAPGDAESRIMQILDLTSEADARDLLDEFERESAEALDALRGAAASGDSPACAKAFHLLQSALLAIGFSEPAEACGAQLAQARGGAAPSEETVRAIAAQIEAGVAAAHVRLEAHRLRTRAPAPHDEEAERRRHAA
ncbi:MAG: putative multi-sensor Histidine kinase, partial [Hyphomicrobiales bacterium]|nr:putative multi-sensor Histidine kinase [Hyphomicrobiales bacterium]